MVSFKKLFCAALLIFLTLATFAADLSKGDYDALESTIREYAPELLSRPSVKKLLNPLEWKRVEKVKVSSPIISKMKKLLDLTDFYSYDASVAHDNADAARFFGSGAYYLFEGTTPTAQELFLDQFIAFECPDEYNAAVAKLESNKKAEEEHKLKEQEERIRLAEDEAKKKVPEINECARKEFETYYLNPDISKRVRKALQKQQKLLSKGKSCAFKDGDFLNKFIAFAETLTSDRVVELSYQKDFVGPYRINDFYSFQDTMVITSVDVSLILCDSGDVSRKCEWFYDIARSGDYDENGQYIGVVPGLLKHFETKLAKTFVSTINWDELWTICDNYIHDQDKIRAIQIKFTPITFYLFYYYLDLLKQETGAA